VLEATLGEKEGHDRAKGGYMQKSKGHHHAQVHGVIMSNFRLLRMGVLGLFIKFFGLCFD